MSIMWFSPGDLTTNDVNLSITHDNGLIAVLKRTNPGSSVARLAMPLPPDIKTRNIVICYRVTNSATAIGLKRVLRIEKPGQTIALYGSLDLMNSTVAVAHTLSPQASFTPTGATDLELNLVFQSALHEIHIGGVGVEFDYNDKVCVNIKDFAGIGPQGDSTAQIQAAVNFVGAAGGGKVCIPPGIYQVSHAIDLLDHVYLEGSGINQTTLKLKDNIQLTLDPVGNLQDYLDHKYSILRIRGKDDVTISKLHIDGNKALNQTLGGLFFPADGGYQGGVAVVRGLDANNNTILSRLIRIDDCLIENCVRDGIGVQNTRDLRVTNTIIRNNGLLPQQGPLGSFGDGFGIILAGNTQSCVVERCSIFGNVHGGIECLGANSLYHEIFHCKTDSISLRADQPMGFASTHHTIVECVLDNSSVLSASPGCCMIIAASDVTVRDCHFIIRFVAGIQQAPLAAGIAPYTSITIINNRFESLTAPGGLGGPHTAIDMYDTNDFMISGNKVIGFYSAFGVLVARSRQGTVTGNTIVNQNFFFGDPAPVSGTNGIRIAGSTNTTVTANSVRGFNNGVRVDQLVANPNALPSDIVVLGNSVRNNFSLDPITGGAVWDGTGGPVVLVNNV